MVTANENCKLVLLPEFLLLSDNIKTLLIRQNPAYQEFQI